jgi:hypothetical protein
MPHYVPAPGGPAPQAHGFILLTMITGTQAPAAMQAIRLVAAPPPPAPVLSIETISHFEDPNQAGGGKRQPGDRIAVFVNAAAAIQSAAAHAAMDQLVASILALPIGAGQKFFARAEHY